MVALFCLPSVKPFASPILERAFLEVILITSAKVSIASGERVSGASSNNLKKLSRIAEKKNINLNILYLYEPAIILREPDIAVLTYIKDSFKSLETNRVSFFELNDYFKGYKDKYEVYKNLFFINDIHLNKKGNKQVFEEILKKINFK